MASMQYLSESCNPKKMAEIQKTLEKEQQKEQQKQTYPPFYVPKAQHKFGVGVSTPYEPREIKGHSHMHQGKPNPNSSLNSTNPNLNNSYYKPPMLPPNPNKTFTGMLNPNKPPLYPPQPETQPQGQQGQQQGGQVNYLNANKPNLGYGRYS